MRPIVLFGGGRWARILLMELVGTVSESTEIVWVSQHERESAKQWLSRSKLSRVRFLENWSFESDQASAAIIATSVTNHFPLAVQCLQAGIPVLCEKPIATSTGQLDLLIQLSRKKRCPIGVHLEFMYLESAAVFGKIISSLTIHSIELSWMDPWSEQRPEGLKVCEMHTDVIQDQLPHCWSILSQLLPKNLDFRITNVSCDDEKTYVQGHFGLIPFSIRLSRRSATRVRRVIINSGQAELDFAFEPGTFQLSGARNAIPSPRRRPLRSSLGDFFNSLESGSPGIAEPSGDNWLLSIHRLEPLLRELVRGSEMYRSHLDRLIEEHIANRTLDLGNNSHTNMIVDRFLPEYVLTEWIRPVSVEEQRKFANQIANRFFPPESYH